MKFVIRAETKPGERRVTITPAHAKCLIDAGAEVFVEESDTRCISIGDYAANSCTIVPFGFWHSADPSMVIIGLKEIADPPAAPEKLVHRHIYYAHCFKEQSGWKQLLTRFSDGGFLWDYEFLRTPRNIPVGVSFSYYAGVMGAALGVLQWAARVQSKSLQGPLQPWSSFDALVSDLQASVVAAGQVVGSTPAALQPHQTPRVTLPGTHAHPRVIVVGCLGQAGSGAMKLLAAAGVATIGWDKEETATAVGNGYTDIYASDILVNCVYLGRDTEPFVTPNRLRDATRRLTVVADVSCDPNSDNNPVPIYSAITTLDKPVYTAAEFDPPVDVIAIDHLPTLLPRDASERFSADLYPLLIQLMQPDSETKEPFLSAGNLFKEKLAAAIA